MKVVQVGRANLRPLLVYLPQEQGMDNDLGSYTTESESQKVPKPQNLKTEFQSPLLPKPHLFSSLFPYLNVRKLHVTRSCLTLPAWYLAKQSP